MGGVILLVFNMTPTTATGQTHGNVRYAISYELTRETNYLLPDEVDPQDIPTVVLATLVPYSETDRIEKTYFTDDVCVTIITHGTDTRLQDWMTHPAQTILDENGTRVYDSNGLVIADIPHSKKQTDNYQAMQTSLSSVTIGDYPQIAPLTATEVADLQTQGWTVSSLDLRKFILTQGNDMVIIEPDRQAVTTKRMEKGILKNSLEKLFRQDSIGRTYPYRLTEVVARTFAGGLCLHQVTSTTYNHYTVVEDNQLSNRSSNGSNRLAAAKTPKFAAYPNPARDVLFVDVPESDAPVKVALTNSMGKAQAEQTAQSAQTVQFNIEQLPSGVYFVTMQVAGAAVRNTLRFVKE